jgi:hypothetical protein
MFMNSKKIIAILIALAMCRATLYLFAAPSAAATGMSTSALQTTIVKNINQLISQLKSKNTTPEQAQDQLNNIYDLVEAYEQRPDKVDANVAAFNNSLSQVIPKFIAIASAAAGCPPCPAPRSCPPCPTTPSFPTPQMQALLREANATTVDEAILNIQKLKSQANQEVQALVGVLKDVGTEVEEPQNPEVDRDLEKLLSSLNATTAKEARQNVKALEASVEKKVMGLAKGIQIIYSNVAEYANSQKLRDMIKAYSLEDFLKPATHRTLNQEVVNLLYRARTDIFTMKSTLVELDAFFRSNPTIHPPARREISGDAQKQEVAKISLD